jgi:hypothetical protein
MENKAVKHGTVSSKRVTHYSMLRTTEQLLGLGFLGSAAGARQHAQRLQPPAPAFTHRLRREGASPKVQRR